MMTTPRIVEFRTPVVREMTDDEYREHRRRVMASLLGDRTNQRANWHLSPRAV
jgi:hypothetical protein